MFVTIFVHPVHYRLPEYCKTDKFADDTAQIGQIIDDDDRHYLQAITDFVQWLDDNCSELNVGKTKEMITDFRQTRTQPNSVVIKGVEVERVSTYKYLGVVFDSFNWQENKNTIIQKAYCCLHCLRKLRSFNVRPDILQIFLLYCC